MKDFNEVILSLEVQQGLGKAYKKAIEIENSTQWKQVPIHDEKGNMISNDLAPVWNGNHVHVKVINHPDKDQLEISMVSHTQSNLKESVDWYVRMGAILEYENYKTINSKEIVCGSMSSGIFNLKA